jgi:hypothetical protein
MMFQNLHIQVQFSVVEKQPACGNSPSPAVLSVSSHFHFDLLRLAWRSGCKRQDGRYYWKFIDYDKRYRRYSMIFLPCLIMFNSYSIFKRSFPSLSVSARVPAHKRGVFFDFARNWRHTTGIRRRCKQTCQIGKSQQSDWAMQRCEVMYRLALSSSSAEQIVGVS